MDWTAQSDEFGVFILTLNRPHKKNALTFTMYRELTDWFVALERNHDARVVIIRGAGKDFCSGGDVREIIAPLLDRTAEQLFEFTRMTCDLIEAIRGLSIPVLAAVDGVAVGAGSVIALASDMRIVTTRARFGFLFVKVGLCGADMGAAYLLQRVVGLGRATEMLMFGDFVDATDALSYGLANRVVPPEELMETTLTWARRLAAGPRLGLAMTKRSLNDAMGLDLRTALEAEARTQAFCMKSADFREGHDAFIEKRGPVFR
ncbi:MAG: enoyl-CoA hydratase family protein [Myxococcales bacterium]|nr:enoyl-CoA hydratase family protein [Myxococcales bacterium]